ncbi:SDR family oxidoreductase [Priestia megaterium]|uniref:SDR family oxidoreductase n=1 Tax=Priestia megaterium TaxID=1404 RepID=UPI001F146FC1|nr:NAD(P)H-binding protein [Priestia megaterium]UMZ34197.1 NAD(P)H-binding protein [Priestia megaterium]
MLLVTGITGHTGRYFLEELIRHKYQGSIRCILRKTSNTEMLDESNLKIEKIIGDLNDERVIEDSMKGVETVLHIYNIHHSPIIVKNAIKNNVKRVILVHTTGIYSKFKEASEGYRRIEESVFELANNKDCLTEITILRPTMIYGDMCDSNMSKFIKMVNKFRIFPILNGGKSLLQPVNARDLGKAFFQVLMSPSKTSGKCYDLSGEKPIKLIDVLTIISGKLGRKTMFISIPMSVGILIAKLFKVITLNRFDYVEKVQRMSEDRSYSHLEAKQDFGYTPMPFVQGIENEVGEYLKNKESI